MIQIYLPGNTDYTKNGDTVLNPISCIFTPEINGAWTVELENALDDRHQYIVQNAVLSVPTPFNENELFRIQKVVPSDSGVYAIALPLFLDSKNEVFIYDKRPINKTGQGALDDLLEGTKYFGHSNISTANTSYFQMKNLIECIAGDDENSFLKRWGGEVRYSNYDIYINDRLGSDNGARVEFGFNLSSIKETIDMSEVVTQIIPVAYNGYTLPNGKTVDSPNINKYPIVYKRVIHYPDIKLAEDAVGDEENITVCNTLDELYAALRAKAKQEYDNGIDLPSITYDVDMIDLAQTLEYQKFKALVTVNLGDDVYVKHRRLDIETKARIIKLEYDCIRKKIINLIIGDYVPNYFDKQSDITHSVSQVINTNNNTVFADKIKGIIDLMQTGLRAQKNIAQKQDVRAILFEDLDPESPTFGAMCIGTGGMQLAKRRNETNTDWVWGTAIDFQAIYAQYIIAGILSDKLGLNYWNLDTGEFRLSANTKVGNKNIGDYITSQVDASMTQEQIFNTLTNNGTVKGIYMYNGELYVNAGYVKADKLSAISANLGDITGGSLNINNKFIVTSDGKVTATDGTFTGTVNAKSGSIAGFTFNENRMTATVSKTYNYTNDDLERIKQIILRNITPTSVDYAKYDISGDGRISSLDMIRIERLIESGNKITTTYILDPTLSMDSVDGGIFEISVPNHNITKITRFGSLYSSSASFDKLSLKGNDIKTYFSPLGAKTDNGSLVKLWEGSSLVTDGFTVSDDYKFFLVRPGTASGYYNTWIIVPYLTESNSGVFRGIGGFEDSAGGEIYFLRGSVTNGNAKIETCWYRTTANMTNNNSSVQCYIKEVWGVK